MDTTLQLYAKQNFLSELLFIDAKEVKQILNKIKLLLNDPKPDQKTKKKIKGQNLIKGDKELPLLRLRSGDYRIFYTYSKKFISLLSVRMRKDAYDAPVNTDLDTDDELVPINPTLQVVKNELKEPNIKDDLVAQLLNNFNIPNEYHSEILSISDKDDLLNCDIPEIYLNVLLDYFYPKDIVEVNNQPDLVINDPNDLEKYKNGEIAHFLLRLTEQQQSYLNWINTSNNPTLLKGGPGSGKTTIAYYKVKDALDYFLKQDNTPKKILFCTYTNALVNISKELLKNLIGDKYDDYIDVLTVDKIAKKILDTSNIKINYAKNENLLQILDNIKQHPRISSEEASSISHLPNEYLLDEILSVIQGNMLLEVEEYLKNDRTGKNETLLESQRRVIWKFSEILSEELSDKQTNTFQEVRQMAYQMTQVKDFSYSYDAVIIDEAQDLDRASIKLIISLCKNPNNLFITADANQSIYINNFRWEEILKELDQNIQVNVLEGNHRSTEEIATAASNYLGNKYIDTFTREQKFFHKGEKPIQSKLNSIESEIQVVADYIKNKSKELKLPIGAGTVLCPSETIGRKISSGLNKLGLNAEFMKSRDVEIVDNKVKVMTLSASKGLEFPITCIAGMQSSYPNFHANMSTLQQQERLGMERRRLFVGMTRAMRNMMIATPVSNPTDLFDGFSQEYWDMS